MNSDELNPTVSTVQHFHIDCPVCRRHRICVEISDKHWQWDPKAKTLNPSTRFEGGFRDKTSHETVMCKGHFTIINGVVALS